jgi:membrane protein DedA with SNARE-associated domain
MLASAFSWISDLTDTLGDWAGNWWFLGVIFGIALLDSVIPVVPSETTVIIGGVAVSVGDTPYSLWMVIAAGAAGAFVGDNTAYSLGRAFAPRLERRAERKPKFRARLDWAKAQIRERGGLLLITARFIPGGRTILTVSCGVTRQRRAWFIGWVTIAVIIWATYAAGLAYLVGKPFEDNHTAAFWTAFGTALAVNVVIELVRHRSQKRAVQQLDAAEASVERTS